jgi:hydroxymethylglutaryl-CoA reductase (NADPH)
MDLRTFSDDLDAGERVAKRRAIIEKAFGVELDKTHISTAQIGSAESQNCEQMFGAIPMPVGIAGPLRVQFGSDEMGEVYVPLSTTEGALVASINRGCKAISESGGARVSSKYIGITRSIAFAVTDADSVSAGIRTHESEWKKVAEATSGHLKILSYDIEVAEDILFLTIAADTDEAMGMNMVTIASQAVADFLCNELGVSLLAVAGNVDSDKKPSTRTKDHGRGHRAHAEVTLSEEVIQRVLKTTSAALLRTAHAKLEVGSLVAGAIGRNLHVANTIAALYLATGQDVAHVVEGSLSDTSASATEGGIRVAVDLPAVLVGVRGGGTGLPAQRQCLDLVMGPKTRLRKSEQLAQIVAAAVLAGEISLLAALSSHVLASSHHTLARKKS